MLEIAVDLVRSSRQLICEYSLCGHQHCSKASLPLAAATPEQYGLYRSSALWNREEPVELAHSSNSLDNSRERKDNASFCAVDQKMDPVDHGLERRRCTCCRGCFRTFRRLVVGQLNTSFLLDDLERNLHSTCCQGYEGSDDSTPISPLSRQSRPT